MEDQLNLIDDGTIVGEDRCGHGHEDRHDKQSWHRRPEQSPSAQSSSQFRERAHIPPPRQMTPEEKANRILREAEAAKERILPKAGKQICDYVLSKTGNTTASIDETYFVVGK